MEPRITTFAERLKEAMRLRGLTARELSELSGIGESDISRYRNAKYEAAQDNLLKLSEVLGVSIPWLMGYDVPMAPTPRIPADDARDRIKEEYNGLYKLLNKATPEQIDVVENLLKAMIPDDSDDFGA